MRDQVPTYPSFKLVEREPTFRGLFYQLGSPQPSAPGVERQRSAPLTEVEDSSLDVPSGGMVSGERSQDTHSSRKEMLDPEGVPSKGTVTRERSQDTPESQMSAHLHSDGGLQDVLPHLEVMLRQLKDNVAPSMSWSRQLQHLHRHQRSTERHNKHNQLHASRFSQLRITNPLRRFFTRWASLIHGVWVKHQGIPVMVSSLSSRIDAWRDLGINRIGAGVLLHGYDIRRENYHGQKKLPDPVRYSDVKWQAVMDHLNVACQYQAGNFLTSEEKVEFFELHRRSPSKVFVVEPFVITQNGKKRLCMNYKPLNSHVEKVPFKGDGIKQIFASLRPNDYVMGLDVHKFYWHFKLNEASYNLCSILIEDKHLIVQVYRWWTLSFGLTDAPRIAVKTFSPVVTHMRARGTRIAGTMDDWFLMVQGLVRCCSEFKYFVDLVMSLGFNIGPEKYCHIIQRLQRVTEEADQVPLSVQERGPPFFQVAPHWMFRLYGFFWNTRLNAVFIPREKVKRALGLLDSLIEVCDNNGVASLKQVESLRGVLISFSAALNNIQIWMFALYVQLRKSLRRGGRKGGYVLLNQRVSKELRMLKQVLRSTNGQRLYNVLPQLWIADDASKAGYGARIVSTGESVAALFAASGDLRNNSNKRELLADIEAAMFFILKYNIHNVVLGILSDNTTSESYINGNTHVLSLAAHSVDFQRWCWGRGIRLVAKYYPGDDMIAIQVDHLSRVLEMYKEWKVNEEVFNHILSWTRSISTILTLPGRDDECPFSMDMFASVFNTKVGSFVSMSKEKFSVKVDALSFQWSSDELGPVLYACPPFNLISQTIRMIKEAQGIMMVVLVTPSWPSKEWWPSLLQLAVIPPLLFPTASWNLQPPLSGSYLSVHPPRLGLTVWALCASALSRRGSTQFQSRISLLLSKTAEFQHTISQSEVFSSMSASERATFQRVLGSIHQDNWS